MNHFCMFYVIRTDLWDNFYFDSVFAYCSKALGALVYLFWEDIENKSGIK